MSKLEDSQMRLGSLNEAFARYIRHGVPLVTLKAAMTLDGKIAPPPAEALKADAEALPPVDGSPAKSRARTCRNCVTRTTHCWSAPEPFSPTIPCSPIAAAARAGVHYCA